MQDKDMDQHLGQTGVWIKKMTTNEIIFDTTKKYTDRMMDLIRDKILSNTKISDDAFEKIREYLQLHFTSLVTDLIHKDFPDLRRLNPSEITEKKQIITPDGVSLDKPRVYIQEIQPANLIPILPSRKNLKMMLNYQIENVFMVPFFIIALASRDQQKAISIATKEIRELIAEVNRLMRYKEIIESSRTPREEFVRDILIAIDKLKKLPGKPTILKISKEFTPKRTTFYGMLEKHRLEINKEFQVIDKKTKKPFEFS